MGISDNFKRTGNRFSVRTIFKIKRTLRGTLMKIEPIMEAKQMKQRVYNIACGCGRFYIGETSGLL
jgi:hypothetical protein